MSASTSSVGKCCFYPQVRCWMTLVGSPPLFARGGGCGRREGGGDDEGPTHDGGGEGYDDTRAAAGGEGRACRGAASVRGIHTHGAQTSCV
jgi:hypothetical protein